MFNDAALPEAGQSPLRNNAAQRRLEMISNNLDAAASAKSDGNRAK